MDKFYTPHKHSEIAEKIQAMPGDSKARKVFENQSYQACGWLVDSWILDDLIREFDGLEQNKRNPLRAAYLLRIFKKAVAVNEEGSAENLTDTEIYWCQEYWQQYNLLATIKSWINEGETAQHIYDTLMELDELDKTIKSNL